MIQLGTILQARILAEERWNTRFPFSLAPETWTQVFQKARPGEILLAIQKMHDTRDTRPEKIFQRFNNLLAQITSQRSSTF